MKKSIKELLIIFEVVTMMFVLMGCGCSKQEENATVSETNIAAISAQTVEQTNDDQKEQTDVPNDQIQEKEEGDENRVEGDGGGNEYNNTSDKIVYQFEILVSEDEYYYQNAPIDLDDFIDEVNKIKEDKIVIISDHNATQNAYQKLIKKLTELEISYEEITE